MGKKYSNKKKLTDDIRRDLELVLEVFCFVINLLFVCSWDVGDARYYNCLI